MKCVPATAAITTGLAVPPEVHYLAVWTFLASVEVQGEADGHRCSAGVRLGAHPGGGGAAAALPLRARFRAGPGGGEAAGGGAGGGPARARARSRDSAGRTHAAGPCGGRARQTAESVRAAGRRGGRRTPPLDGVTGAAIPEGCGDGGALRLPGRGEPGHAPICVVSTTISRSPERNCCFLPAVFDRALRSRFQLAVPAAGV